MICETFQFFWINFARLFYFLNTPKWWKCLFQFFSPFCKNALAAGIEAEGGKPDDITVLLATVNL